jgi:hypothetical protein
MKNYLLILFCLISFSLKAQNPGDTVFVNTVSYGSTTRDTTIQFPSNPNVSYEKVLMLYNIRCKNGLVSNGSNTNLGCGEWDYSCNTYITDSTKIDSLIRNIPSHTINNFSGTTFNYVTQPYYNKYQYQQINTTITNTTSEDLRIVGIGNLSLQEVLSTTNNSGKSYYIYTQAELAAAGAVTGNIDGLMLSALTNSTANFLQIKLKQTTATTINNMLPDTSNFIEKYNANTTFTLGANRLQFYSPFVWDGVSNIVIEFSFTNSTPASNALLLQGSTIAANVGSYSINNHHINTTGGSVCAIPSTPFASIQNEITVSFWSKGDLGVSTINTISIEGVDSALNRNLNIHLPWSNSRIYFDCGFSSGGYDRIDKLATLTELEQVWNHWTFTKNATSGIMNIYLNGALWHTGTGKTKPINIDSMILGAAFNKQLLYNGNIDELTIWNTELSQATIQSWLYTSINNTHPNYANLIAYYPLEEGIGNSTTDLTSNNQIGSFATMPSWKYVRGSELFKQFQSVNTRPNTTFIQGVYTLSNQTSNVLDSIVAPTNNINTYSIISNLGTNVSDITSFVSSTSWIASFSYLYDANTGLKLDSTAIIPTGTITITNLPYMIRRPANFEIMSFVTPYGINLNMGINGKTWTFDVTDYLPILKDKRRMFMTGGIWQEDMDIRFAFIVGTPVRDVKDITNIWPQNNQESYTNIINDNVYEPRNVLMNPAATSYKIRTMITGHGQEGEFIPRDHFIDINGGSDEFVWNVYKKCASNPLYPQGGTWIYDRAGWCPGMATDLKEMDITPYVTPGQMANIDYGMYTASGDSRYIVSNFLVSYGAINKTLDAAITDIMAPTNKFEYAREHAMCAKPIIELQNTGTTTLTTATFEYWLNNFTSKSTYTWTGSLAPLEKIQVELPNTTLWLGLNGTLDNEFNVEIKNINNSADGYVHNNKMKSFFKLPEVVPSDFIIYYRSNNFAAETKYELFNELGTSLLLKQNLNNNTTYRDTMKLGMGCYKLVVTDTDEDGINFWANNDGAGVLQLKKINGANLKTFNPDFGASIIYNFTIDFPLTYSEFEKNTQIQIYPNPTSSTFTIDMLDVQNAQVTVTNSMGQTLNLPNTKKMNSIVFDAKNIAKGLYYITIVNNDKKTTHKIVIE